MRFVVCLRIEILLPPKNINILFQRKIEVKTKLSQVKVWMIISSDEIFSW